MDERSHERSVYDEDGYRIPRRHAAVQLGVKPAGILFNLANFHRLFESEEDDFEEDPQGSTLHYVYPIACLRNVGQFQAHGILNCLVPILHRINERLATHTGEFIEDSQPDEGSSSEIEGSYQRRTPPHRPHYYYVKPVASQGYNAFSHRVRTGARFHDVQKGMISAALAGTHASGTANQRKAKALYTECSIALPFDRYHEKITGTSFDQSLRVENVFTIMVHRVPRRMRHGRQVSPELFVPYGLC